MSSFLYASPGHRGIGTTSHPNLPPYYSEISECSIASFLSIYRLSWSLVKIANLGVPKNRGCSLLSLELIRPDAECYDVDWTANLRRDNFFLVADDYRNEVYQLDSDLQSVSAIKTSPFDRPIGVDYDFVDDRVYWTDFESSVIKRAFLNGSSQEIIKPAELGLFTVDLRFCTESQRERLHFVSYFNIHFVYKLTRTPMKRVIYKVYM